MLQARRAIHPIGDGVGARIHGIQAVIIAVQGAENRIAVAEDLTLEELEHMHEHYRRCASETLGHLSRRRGETVKQAS